MLRAAYLPKRYGSIEAEAILSMKATATRKVDFDDSEALGVLSIAMPLMSGR